MQRSCDVVPCTRWSSWLRCDSESGGLVGGIRLRLAVVAALFAVIAALAPAPRAVCCDTEYRPVLRDLGGGRVRSRRRRSPVTDRLRGRARWVGGRGAVPVWHLSGEPGRGSGWVVHGQRRADQCTPHGAGPGRSRPGCDGRGRHSGLHGGGTASVPGRWASGHFVRDIGRDTVRGRPGQLRDQRGRRGRSRSGPHALRPGRHPARRSVLRHPVLGQRHPRHRLRVGWHRTSEPPPAPGAGSGVWTSARAGR